MHERILHETWKRIIFERMNVDVFQISVSIKVERIPLIARIVEVKITRIFICFCIKKDGARGRTRTATPAIGHGF